MAAQALTFVPMLQETVEEGVLSPRQAFLLEMELTALAHLGWSSPEVRSIGQLVDLYLAQRPPGHLH